MITLGRTKHGGLIVGLAILLTCTVAAAALAGPQLAPERGRAPLIETFHNEGNFALASCDGFDAIADYAEDVTFTTFFDDDGNPIRVHAKVEYRGTITNSVTGFTVRDNGHISVFLDLVKGTQANVGLIYGITIPGHGMVLLDAGKVVWDAEGNVTFQGGPHQVVNGGEAVICAALSGPPARISHPAPALSSPAAEDRAAARAVACAVGSGPRDNPVIRYSLPVGAHVTLTIHDVAGRRLGRLVDGFQSAGSHEVSWNSRFRDANPGVYLYRFEALGRSVTGRFVLLK